MTIKPRPGAQRVSPALGAGKDPRARRSGTNEVEFPLVYENGVLKLVLSGTSPLAVDPQRGLYERVADGLEVSSASPYATRVSLGDGLELRAGRIVPRFSKTVQVNAKKQIVAVVSTDDVSDPTDGTAAAAIGRIGAALTALDGRVDALEVKPTSLALIVSPFTNWTLPDRDTLILGDESLVVPFGVGDYTEARLTINLRDQSGTDPLVDVSLRGYTGFSASVGDFAVLGDASADVWVDGGTASAAWSCFDTGWVTLDTSFVAGDERWLAIVIKDSGEVGGQSIDVGSAVAHFR